MNENTSLLRFLTELRKRLLFSLITLALCFAALSFFANDLYTGLALPLLKRLPEGHGIIATNLTAPFFVPFELTFVASLFLCVPFFIYQLWMFVAPALYRHERLMIWPLLLVSTVLFYAGVLFAYFIVFPLMLGFLTQSVPQGVLMSPDMSSYLDFSLKLFFIFGMMFNVPVVMLVLITFGIVERETLVKWRPYAIVMAFVLGMLLSPPDVLSQTILAIPLWFLFEIGLVLSRFVAVQKRLQQTKD